MTLREISIRSVQWNRPLGKAANTLALARSAPNIDMQERLRVLIFILAYNAEKTIASVLDRIPRELEHTYDVRVLVIDDCSRDATWQRARERLETFWCPGEALRNPVNQGYGGNQKVGYRYAAEQGFDVVAMVHGDGQYAPECLPQLLEPFTRKEAQVDAVFGSRMLHKRDALKGGMPYYKFVGNMVLTTLQNRLLGTRLSEFHTGYRVYRVSMLAALPLELDTNDFDFDTEIIMQVVFSGGNIVELPIPTHYGDEVCHVNGLRYAWDVMLTSLKGRLIRMGLFYDPKFFFPQTEVARKVSTFSFPSTGKAVADSIRPGSLVLDLGCSDMELSAHLRQEKGCTVISCPATVDLDRELPDAPWEKLDYVVALDVLEQRDSAEDFLARLRERLTDNPGAILIAGSANVGFFITRLMLLFGQFNYGRRGILALSHKRLFTIASLARLMRYAGYRVVRKRIMAAPYPRALGNNLFSRGLMAVNRLLAKVLPGLFAYQVLLEVRHTPSTESVLRRAQR